MFTFLLIVQTVIAASLVLTILMQRSEGGGFPSDRRGRTNPLTSTGH